MLESDQSNYLDEKDEMAQSSNIKTAEGIYGLPFDETLNQ